MTESTSFLQRLAKGRLGSLAITLDQLAFSAAAFLLQFAGAHSSGNAAFAGFSLVTLIQTGQWYLSRAAASETVLVGRHLQGSGAAVAAQRSMDTALLIGFVGSAVCLGGAALTDGPLRWLFLMQVVASPIAAVFDHSRYLLLASGRAVHAFLLDTLWTLTMLVAVAALLVTGNLTPVAVFLSWGLALVVPTAIGFKLTGVKLPVPGRQLRAWFDQNRKLVPGFLVDAAFLTFGIYVTFAVIWLVTGDENLGLFRKALIPVTVLNVVMMGITTVLLTTLTQRAHRATTLRVPMLATVGGGIIALIGVLIMLVLPTNLMELLFNASWDQMRPLVFVLMLYGFMQLVTQNAVTFAKSHGRSWVGPRVRGFEAVVEVTLVGVFGSLFGIIGVPWALVAAWGLASPIAWRAAMASRAEPETVDPAVDVTTV
ncbi:MAG TPA: hypothetical protein VL652_44610 [Kutzneria sp.]|nr:hypothetical protein [Kutzneria sp.]